MRTKPSGKLLQASADHTDQVERLGLLIGYLLQGKPLTPLNPEVLP